MIRIIEENRKSLILGSLSMYFVMLVASFAFLHMPSVYLVAMALVLTPALIFGKKIYRTTALLALIFTLSLIALNIAVKIA